MAASGAVLWGRERRDGVFVRGCVVYHMGRDQMVMGVGVVLKKY